MATDDEVAVVVDVRAGVGWVWKRPGDEKVAGFLITNTRTVRMTVRLQPQSSLTLSSGRFVMVTIHSC
jgi:hypothetical protein